MPDDEEEEAVVVPLIEDLGRDRAALDGPPSPESQLARPNRFIWALTLTAGISGLLFGYDTGVISSTLVSIGDDLGHPLTILDMSLIASCTSFFALIASPATGLLADRIGRKKAILIADILFIAGASWQAITSSVAGMIVGRSVVGLAIGGASLSVPIYISELSPSSWRGRLVTLNIVLVTAGQVVSYMIGWILSTRAHGWRWMVGLGAAPAILQFGLLLLFLPETPRWLFKNGYPGTARTVLGKVYSGSEPMVAEVIRAMSAEILEEEGEEEGEEEEEAAAAQRLTSKPSADDSHDASPAWSEPCRMTTLTELLRNRTNRRALMIACLVQGLQQLCGFNSLMYFSATIFSLIGFSSPTLTSLSIAMTNFTSTLVAFTLIDRIGRRRILLSSLPIMIIGLLSCSISYQFLHLPLPPTSQPLPTNSPPTSPPPLPAFLILASLLLYTTAYAIGLGNLAWQQSELFSYRVRSLGSGLATGVNWGSNFVVGLTFLAYAAVCALGWALAWWVYPETKGVGLEGVRGVVGGEMGRGRGGG